MSSLHGASADDDAALKALIHLDSQEMRLTEYRDPPEILRIKQEDLRRINEERRKYGANPVEFDILASRVANKHCTDMAKRGYLSHWNENGEKPYHRYAFAGGVDHVEENLFSMSSSASLPQAPADIEPILRKALQVFMSEPPGNDAHKKTLIDPAHTHVGTGIALVGRQFRYAQEFLDRYIIFDSFDPMVGSDRNITLSGTVIPGDIAPLAVIVSGEILKPMSIAGLNASGIYEDFSPTMALKLWPWDIPFNRGSKSFTVQLNLSGLAKSYYYVQIKLKRGIASIPYEGGQVTTEGTFDASGIILNLDMPVAIEKHVLAATSPSGIPSSGPGNVTPSPAPSVTPQVTPVSSIPALPSSSHGTDTAVPDYIIFLLYALPFLLAAAAVLCIYLYMRHAARKREQQENEEEERFRF